jgi:hypothetical protein
VDLLRIYTRIHALPNSGGISDLDWIPLIAKENDLLSAMIKTNEWQHAHQIKEMVVERIACEMRGHGTGINHQRQIFDGLLSEFYQLRWGQRTRFPHEDRLPGNDINVIPGEDEFIIYDGAIYKGQIPIVFSRRE